MAEQGEFEHPYIPRDMKLPGFVPTLLSQSTILSCYVLASLLAVSFTWILSGKEYSKGDSRYVGRDSTVIALEGIVAVILGPACLLAVYAIATKKSYSYILQLAISLGHLYGTAVYFIASFLDGDDFAVNTFYYVWYYMFANVWWVLIPSIISIRCWKMICAACGAQEQKKTKIR